MKILTRVALILTALLILTAGVERAGASFIGPSIICNSWSQGNYSGSQVYSCNFQNNSTGGSYNSSYQCLNALNPGNYCQIQYAGGNTYSGPCTLIFQCTGGQTYTCGVGNWNGKDVIQCYNAPKNCYGIEICKGTPTPSVNPIPEPSSIIAGALLLIPLGISMVRIVRSRKGETAHL